MEDKSQRIVEDRLTGSISSVIMKSTYVSLHSMLGKQMEANSFLNSACSTLPLGDIAFSDEGLNQFTDLPFFIIPSEHERST